MKTAGNFVSGVIEFSTCVKFCENDLESRNFFGRMNISGNTSTVILDSHGIIDVNGYRNVFAMSCERFVDRVIDNFPNEMVKSSGICIPDVHAGAFSDSVQTFKYLNRTRTIS